MNLYNMTDWVTKKLFIALAFFALYNVWGQNEYFYYKPTITPSTPEEGALLKYIESPVSPSSGIPGISIPIYTITEGDISFPVSINYNAAGIRVNEVASSVGMGWSLSFPKIVRVVKGIPDDVDDYGFIHEEDYTVAAVENISNHMPAEPDPNDDWQIAMKEVQRLVKLNSLDLESDLYNIFLPSGESVQFMFNQNRSINNPYGEIVTFPKSYVKINPVFSGKTITGWEITDVDGTKYIFIGGDYISGSHGFDYGDLDLPVMPHGNDPIVHPHINSWNISQIVSPSGNNLSFSYDSGITYTECSFTNQMKGAGNSGFDSRTYQNKTLGTNKFLESITGSFGQLEILMSGREDYTGGKKIDRIQIISSDNDTLKEVEFDYDYTIDTNSPGTMVYCGGGFGTGEKELISKRLFLEKVIFYDAEQEESQEYGLEYDPEVLPHRFSYAQDWWGYYNGQTSNRAMAYSVNADFWTQDKDVDLPNRHIDITKTQAGLLKKIIYPTGGYTEYTYENNRGVYRHAGILFEGNNIIPPVIEGVDHVFDYDDNYTTSGGIVTYDDIPFTIDQDVINYYKEFSWNNDLYIKVYLKTLLSSSSGVDCSIPFGQIHTPLDCYSRFEIIDVATNQVVETNYNRNGDEYTMSFKVGNTLDGLSAKNYILRMKGYSASGSNPEIFNPLQQYIDSEISWYVYDPALVTKIGMYDYEIPIGGLRTKKITHVDNPNISGGGLVKEYSYKNSEGIESGTYNVKLDFFQVVNINRLVVNSQNMFPLQTSGSNVITYQNVKERQKPFNQPLNSDVLEIQNQVLYYEGTGNKTFGCYYYGWPNLPVYNSYSAPCFQNPKNGKTFQTDYEDDKTVFYEFNGGGGVLQENRQLSYVTGIDYNTTLLFTDLGSYGDFCSVGCLEGYGSNEFLPFYDYFYYSVNQFYDEPVKKVTTTDHLNNDIVQINETVYHQAYPFLPVETKFTNSLTEVLKTQYQYPQDLPLELHSSDLVAANRISQPLVVKTFNGTDPLSEQKTLYKEFTVSTSPLKKLILPEFIYAKKGTNTLEKKITYDSYDVRGNLTQYTLENGTPVSIIWGYNGQYPIAKVEGATYNTILSIALTLQGASDSGTLSAASFETLRNTVGAIVTCYIYQPLVGLTTIIQPNGQKETYHYDASGRLEYVKDHEGNILKKIGYNYKD